MKIQSLVILICTLISLMNRIAKSLSSEESEKIAHYLHGMKLMRECPNSKGDH